MKRHKKLRFFLSLLSCVFSAVVSQADEGTQGVLARALFTQEEAEKYGVDLRGWASGSGNWNAAHRDGGYNGPVSFNDRADRVQLYQLYIIGERKITSDSLSLGGRFDFTYGADSAFTTSRGFDDQLTSDGTSRIYKAAIPQAYLELGLPCANGLTIKAGHFYTLLGYEVVPAKDNFFHSHSYSMQYGEPFTHWGALASMPAGEQLTVTAGAVRGWDNLSDSSDGNLSFLGGVTYAPNDDTTAVFSLITGNEGTGRNQTGYSAVVTHAFSDDFTYVLQHDLGRVASADSGSGAQWYSIANYFIEKITDKISIGERVEWFRDDDGARVVGLRSGAGGVPANYFEVSLGANVEVLSNLMFRPEIRFDYQDLIKGGKNKAFNGGLDSSQVVSSANLILSF